LVKKCASILYLATVFVASSAVDGYNLRLNF
jgi:hypothetical protein